MRFHTPLSERGAPELDGSVQRRRRTAADLSEHLDPRAERAGGAPAGPQEVPQHEVSPQLLNACAGV